MIFKQLTLTSFGKFKNKTIDFDKGINIIYGENEAGKTTVHRFIEGMLYGFFKPYTKRRIYTDDYNKYLPWSQNDFCGVLKYANDNDSYRIERNFIKGSDEVKIFDDETGENLIHMFEYDNIIKLHKPTSAHYGFNSIVYNNTISIKQLNNKTEDDLAKEVKDSLINLGGSLDEDISVKKAIEKLDEKINLIGTKSRVKTSPLGKIVKELEKLSLEKEKTVKIYEEIKEYQMELNDVKNAIQELKLSKDSLERNLDILEVHNIKQRYKEADTLSEGIRKHDYELKDLKGYSHIELNDYMEAIRKNSAISNVNDSLNDFENKHDKLLSRYRELDSEISALGKFGEFKNNSEVADISSCFTIMQEKERDLREHNIKADELKQKINSIDEETLLQINKDNYQYEKLDEEKNRLLYGKNYANESFLKMRLVEKAKGIQKYKAYIALSIIGALSSIIIGYLIEPLLYATMLIPIVIGSYSLYSYKELKKYITKLETQILEIQLDEHNKNEKIQILNNQMELILKKYNCMSKSQFRALVNEYSMDCALIKDKKDNLKSLNEIIMKLENDISYYRNSIKKYLGSDKEINLKNIKNFKIKYNKYIELNKDFTTIENEITQIKIEKEKLKEKYRLYQNKLQEILEKNHVKDLEEFKKGLDLKKEYESILQQRESKEKLLRKVLGENSIEFLRKKSNQYDNIKMDEVNAYNKDELNDNIKDIDEKLKERGHELTRLEEKVKNLFLLVRPLVEIDEDINRTTNTMEKYERKLDALNLAKDTINNISKEIQRDFAPNLNKKVSGIIKSITNGKYSNVKINQSIDVKVIDSLSRKLIEIDKLSGGTIDQLYFATRLGIIDIISGHSSFPLILDDCFTQYDIKRLENILVYLANEGIKRQILLFSCHIREKEILDKMKVRYNYIEL